MSFLDESTEFVHDEPMARINVTPLVDVILVLLIIFMITAPMMNMGIDLNLPGSGTSTVKEKEKLTVTIKEDGSIYLEEDMVDIEILPGEIEAVSAVQNRTLFIKADRNVAYGKVIRIMDILRENGIRNISLITSPTEEK